MQQSFQKRTNEFSFRLAPSKKRGGVGVFATHAIKKGTKLNLFNSREPRLISRRQDIEPLRKKFYRWFCIETKKGFLCPENFSQMEIGWYLNHSENPNTCWRNSAYYAAMDIKSNEEITMDYSALDGEINNLALPKNF